MGWGPLLIQNEAIRMNLQRGQLLHRPINHHAQLRGCILFLLQATGQHAYAGARVPSVIICFMLVTNVQAEGETEI